MAKRFTATEKWDDAWFADRLTRDQRTAWMYLCDKCDLAGVADISFRNASLFVGDDFDWDELVRVSEGRIEKLPSGKFYLTGFIAFQYGTLNENCNAHRAVLKAIEKHGIPDTSGRDTQPIPNPTRRDQDKDKDKDKDKDLKGGVGENKRTRTTADPLIPAKFSLPIREKLAEWLRYKAENRDRYKPTGLKAFFTKAANAVRDYGESAVIDSIDTAMANGWKGWDHSLGKARGSPEPIDRREAAILEATREMEARNGPRQPQQSDQHLLCDHRRPDP